MVACGGSRLDKILEVVKKWRKFTKLNRSYSSLSSFRSSTRSLSFSSASFTDDMRTRSSDDMSDSDFEDDSFYCPEDVPEGYLAVYVGEERRRFVICTQWLNHRLFKALLDKSEQEYGFRHKGGLTLACEVVLFEHLVWLLSRGDPAAWNLELDALLSFHDDSHN